MARQLTHKTQAMRLLESFGWQVADVEKWIPGTRITKDLWQFADVIAVKPGVGTLALQVTSVTGGKSGSNVGSRVKNVLAARKELLVCLKAGWQVEVWGIRNHPTKTGSTVLARSIELDGANIVAFEGSHVLPKELTDGCDRETKSTQRTKGKKEHAA